jgi:hypothetical protein
VKKERERTDVNLSADGPGSIIVLGGKHPDRGPEPVARKGRSAGTESRELSSSIPPSTTELSERKRTHPVGILASNSIFPYRMLWLSLVVSRADRTGGRIVPVVEFEVLMQLAPVVLDAVQVSVRLSV